MKGEEADITDKRIQHVQNYAGLISDRPADSLSNTDTEKHATCTSKSSKNYKIIIICQVWCQHYA